MFTPQEIQEQTFSKAVFGGYDMQQVDDFLEPLTEDYITLYKENSVLKSKMKILVEKLEEYRAQEARQKAAPPDPRVQSDQLLQEARARSEQMLRDTQAKSDELMRQAQAKSDELMRQTQTRCAAMTQDASAAAQTGAISQKLREEQERLDYAKQAALNFINVIEQDIQGHLDLLETLKSRDLSLEKKEEKKPASKPYDWQTDPAEAAEPEPEPEPEPVPAAEPESEPAPVSEPEPEPAPAQEEEDDLTFDFLADLPDLTLPKQPEPKPEPAPAPSKVSENTQQIASEISDRLEELIGGPSPAAPAKPAARPAVKPLHPESATIKFEDLKFGKNYNPTQKN